MNDNILRKVILDSTDNIIYVSDIDTYEVLYINGAGKKRYQINGDDYKRQKCYELLQGKKKPCEFCTNEKILWEGSCRWIRHNKYLDRYFAIADYLIELTPGYHVRMEIATDITEKERQKKRLGSKIKQDETLLLCIKTLNDTLDLDCAINRLLELIADYYGGDRTYIFEIDHDQKTANNTYEWCDKNITSEIDQLQGVPLSALENWLSQFKKCGSFSISSLDQEMNQESEAYGILRRQGIKSLMAAPLYERGKLSGFIGVDDPKRNRENPDLLKSVTYFIANDLEKRRMVARLEYLSYVDILTGLWNRNKYMEEVFDIEHHGCRNIGVAYVDLNGLKIANNRYGHEYGDKLIIRTAEILESIFGKQIYRIGGDEFVVLCRNISRKEFQDKELMLRKKVKEHREISASIGTTWEEEITNINELINHADELMYANKQKYYEFSVYGGYNHDSAVAEQVLKDIRQDRYQVFLQPKVYLHTGELSGAEALIRRVDSSGELIFPDRFIPLYEAEGVIRHIDFYALECVCRLIRQMHDEGHDIGKISVNFSRVTLLEYDIVNRILAVCKKYDVDAGQICIEVTESVSKLKTTELVVLAQKIKDAGFYLSLDDYGAKYSNITLLSNIKFDEVKLDKSIISEIMTNERARAIVRSTIYMCRGFGNTKTTAEGIETEEQMEFLREFQCDCGQGYYFSRPVDTETFIKEYVK
ncbi:sensor domain-containing phosphodiesterase [Anaerostipes sp.]|uniref:sensor domain-containing phosphodiesterase n=1 Tax=Anaerostipes sp. TaxID=1872530 RepID=UPI0025C4A8BF|nr:GGDEF domain-containing protein [Anaerostipes sp.]MBS7007405.1 GGDEF domain-containing protein [Anaerostipes sp.]